MKQQVLGYLPGNTLLHRMDALTKFGWVVCVTLLAFALPGTGWIAVQVGVLIALCVVGRPPGAPLIRPLLLLGLLAALLMVFQTMNVKTGDHLFDVGPIAVHEGGVARGGLYTLRVISMMLASFVFVRTTDPRGLVIGLIKLGMPYRVAWMVFLSLMSASMFRRELSIAREAQLVRGVPPARTIIHERLTLWRRYAQSLLVSGLRRVEVVSVAMDARGFGAAPTRTFIDPFRWSVSGSILLGLWLVALVASIVARVAG